MAQFERELQNIEIIECHFFIFNIGIYSLGIINALLRTIAGACDFIAILFIIQFHKYTIYMYLHYYY